MAYDTSKLTTLGHLQNLAEKVKTACASQADLDTLDGRVDSLESAGGEPNVIETIKVNGTAQTVTGKAVNITVPTKTSALTNDSDYQTSTQVATAIANAGHASFEVASAVPSASAAQSNVFYLVKNSTTGYYDIYALVGGSVVRLDDTTVDLTGYVQKETGKGLSANDFTDDYKTKLDGLSNYTHPTTSGNKHIPSGGSSGQILRWSADGTAAWGADNNTTYSAMTGATSSAAGTSGLVPAPASGKQASFLRGDGTWATPANTTYSAGTGLALSGTTFNHSNSVEAGTAQGDASKTLTFGGTFTVPTVTYDAQGHITAKGTTTMTMPANPNSDTKVTQTLTSTSANYPLLLAPTGQTATATTTANFGTKFQANPSTGVLTATTFSGALSGNASTATKATQDSAGQQINTTYIKDLSVSGTTITYTKGDGSTGTITTQDTNTTYSDMTGATSSAAGAHGLVPAPAAGAQAKFLRGDGTWQTPTDTNTDTKVNVTLATTTKAYLLATSTTPTSTAAGVTALADTGVYLDTTAGKLTATSFAGSGASLTSLNASNLSSGTVAAARLPAATTSAQGAMSAADKTKLDGISIATDTEVTEMLTAVFG